jgi:transposase
MKIKGSLTQEQISVLNKAIKDKSINKDEAMRIQAILLLNEGLGEQIIRAVTGLKKKQTSRLRLKFLKYGITGLKTRKRKSRALLTKNQKAEFEKTLITKTPKDLGINADFWTTSIVAEYLEKEYNVVYKSKTSYCVILKDFGFTYHKPDKTYKNRNQKQIDAWLEENLSKIAKYLDDENIVVLCGDEMILTSQTTTQKIWLIRGNFRGIETSNKRDKRCIYGFLNVKNGVEHAFKTDYTNSMATCNVLKKLIKIYPDQKIVLFWDNATWHKSKTVRDFLINNPERFHLIAFPPYAPEHNPQEHVWKAGRKMVTHNKFIAKIDFATDEFVTYLNSTKFSYKFL